MADNGPVVHGVEWLRHRVADKLSRPGVVASQDLVMSRIGNMTSHTAIAPFETYTDSARAFVDETAAHMELVVCHNRWGRDGVQGLFCVVADGPRGHLVELQVHTPASAGAREHAHLLRDMIRQAGHGSFRAADLRRRQHQVLVSVPVPVGAAHLSWPGRARA